MTWELYPLLTDRRLVETIWGGTRLADWLDLPEPRPQRLGETWQVFDSNPIRNGRLAGRTLAELTHEAGAALVGTRTVERYGADFPLLAKFIDANDRLSIQVHPDDAYAHSREAATGFHGKTEAWYILDCPPGADVVYGPLDAIDRTAMVAAIEATSLEPLLRRLPVVPGDVVFVPAGTLHAINAGIMLFEIQQKSDLTYRVYDYGRRDASGQLRQLHLDKALDVIDYQPALRAAVPSLPLEPDDARTLLVACPSFALERWTLTAARVAATDPGSFEILTLIAGNLTIEWSGSPVAVRQGESLVLPANLGRYSLRPAGDEVQLLRAYVPDLEYDLIAPLRAQGVDDEQIARTVSLS